MTSAIDFYAYYVFIRCLQIVGNWLAIQRVTAGQRKLTPNVINTLRPRQNGRHFADDIFTCIFLSENAWIPIKISLKFVPKGPINNIPALVLIMAWRRPGDKPLSEPMGRLKTHICVTRPHWVLLLPVMDSHGQYHGMNSWWPSDAYMRRQTNTIGSDNGLSSGRHPSHYLNQCWNATNWTPRNKLQWNFSQNTCIFIRENQFENVVWKMTTMLSRPQCAK